MARYTLTFLIYFFFIYFSHATDNGINQLYMSVQHDVLFEPISNDYILQKFIFMNRIECPIMCLRILGCQLVMYNSTGNGCTIYNSTIGVLNSLDGYVIYTVKNTMVTTTTTEGTTTITTTTAKGITTTTTRVGTSSSGIGKR